MHFPSDYRYVCEWNVTVKNGKTIEVDITTSGAHANEGNQCDDNYVLVGLTITGEFPR